MKYCLLVVEQNQLKIQGKGGGMEVSLSRYTYPTL